MRNVLAADGGHLIRGGRRYRLTKPERIHGDLGRRLLPGWSRVLMRFVRVNDHVEVTAAEVPAEPAS